MGPWSSIFSLNLLQLTLWGQMQRLVKHSLFVSFLPYLCTNLVWCSSSLSTITGFLSIKGITLHTRWLNSIVAWLGIPCPSGVVQICNKAMWMSSPESAQFFNVCLMNMMQALTCPLLWWWYADDTACSMLSLLQNLLNFCENKIGASVWN